VKQCVELENVLCCTLVITSLDMKIVTVYKY